MSKANGLVKTNLFSLYPYAINYGRYTLDTYMSTEETP